MVHNRIANQPDPGWNTTGTFTEQLSYLFSDLFTQQITQKSGLMLIRHRKGNTGYDICSVGCLRIDSAAGCKYLSRMQRHQLGNDRCGSDIHSNGIFLFPAVSCNLRLIRLYVHRPLRYFDGQVFRQHRQTGQTPFRGQMFPFEECPVNFCFLYLSGKNPYLTVTAQSFSPTGKFQMTVFQHFIKRCPSVGRKSYSQRFNM